MYATTLCIPYVQVNFSSVVPTIFPLLVSFGMFWIWKQSRVTGMMEDGLNTHTHTHIHTRTHCRIWQRERILHIFSSPIEFLTKLMEKFADHSTKFEHKVRKSHILTPVFIFLFISTVCMTLNCCHDVYLRIFDMIRFYMSVKY